MYCLLLDSTQPGDGTLAFKYLDSMHSVGTFMGCELMEIQVHISSKRLNI